ncbi:MAG: uroporphyrinogen-III synthase [Rikenellaceae bacterium]|nr:uroporphyrinogen-III synthase [Rikenellaceae bacterium]
MKIKNLLVSQPAPAVIEKSPFFELTGKYDLAIDYRPFIHVEGVSAKEFRSQRVEILEHTAIIFTSRTTIDNFFRICEETRTIVPETMKYLCNTEAVALYLQKYIVYRKRKISFADGSFNRFMELILKHKNEKFLLTLSEPHKPEIPETLTRLKIKFDPVILARTVSSDLSDVDLAKYQLLVFYSPSEIKTLTEKFPGAKMPMIATFGETTTRKAIESGLTVSTMAPSAVAPSMARALDIFIGEINAGRQPETVTSPADNRQADEFVRAHQTKEMRRDKAKKKSAAVASKSTDKTIVPTKPTSKQ